MSAFLGPIHYWLYNKIQLQEEFIQDILDVNDKHSWDKTLEKEMKETCGEAECRPLEEIIDQGNIHGWLQYHIGISETRLAYTVTRLIKGDNSRINILQETAFSFGQKHKIKTGTNAEEAFKILNDSLLDGMPCDRVNEPLEQSKEKAVWRQTQCVHQNYWEEIDGDISVYYELREQIIKGMLIDSGLTFAAEENGIFSIKQEG
jgi:hypothetical protein